MLKKITHSTLAALLVVSLGQSAWASPDSDLITAVRAGKLPAVQKALQQKASPNARDESGTSALELAVDQENLALVTLLLSRGADINVKTTGGSLLTNTLVRGNVALTRLLLSKGIDKQALGEVGPKALVTAVLAADKAMIELLLANKVSPNALATNDDDEYEVTMYGGYAPRQTPLMHAVRRDSLAMVRYLQAKGASVNARSETGDTALMLALDLSSPEMLDYLLNQKADVRLANQAGETPLSKAVALNKPELVKRLLARGAEPAFLNQAGVSALDLACQQKALATVGFLVAQLKDPVVKTQALSHSLIRMAGLGHMDMVKHLLSLGAEPRLADAHGQTALMGAAQSGKLDIVRLMLGLGLSSETRDAEGATALMYAARGGNPEVFSELLLRGGDLGETSRRGDTLLMVAAAWNHPELVTYLIERRLDVNARNNLGQTALMLASDGSATYPNPEDESRVSDKQDAYVKTQLALIDLLLAQGADPSFKDKAGLSLLHYATKGFETPQGFCWQPASIAEALATKALKVDLDARDPLGRTVLMNAVFANGAGLLESLLKQGANPNLQDLDGNYALLGLVTRSCQVEAKYGLVSYDAIDHADFKKKVELLLARGADYKLVNKAGKSALSEASEVFKSKNAN